MLFIYLFIIIYKTTKLVFFTLNQIITKQYNNNNFIKNVFTWIFYNNKLLLLLLLLLLSLQNDLNIYSTLNQKIKAIFNILSVSIIISQVV